jgi:hypothetical protein
MFTTSPNTDLFYLRMLLSKRVNMATFIELRTVGDIVYQTYHATCRALNLLADDLEWVEALQEICEYAEPHKIRKFFAMILYHNSPIRNPEDLFDSFKDQMSDDIKYQRLRGLNTVGPHNQADYDECKWRLNDIIIHMSGNTKILSDFELLLPSRPREASRFIANHELNFELSYDIDEQKRISEMNVATLH